MNAPVSHSGLVQHYTEVRSRLRNVSGSMRPALLTVTREVPIAPQVGPDASAHVWAWRQHTDAVQRFFATKTAVAIERQVVAKHGFSIVAIKSRSRNPALTPARRELAYRLRHEIGLSFTKIARRMGRKDHSTARHHCEQFAKTMAGQVAQ